MTGKPSAFTQCAPGLFRALDDQMHTPGKRIVYVL
jgi:hypothetical protein